MLQGLPNIWFRTGNASNEHTNYRLFFTKDLLDVYLENEEKEPHFFYRH